MFHHATKRLIQAVPSSCSKRAGTTIREGSIPATISPYLAALSWAISLHGIDDIPLSVSAAQHRITGGVIPPAE